MNGLCLKHGHCAGLAGTVCRTVGENTMHRTCQCVPGMREGTPNPTTGIVSECVRDTRFGGVGSDDSDGIFVVDGGGGEDSSSQLDQLLAMNRGPESCSRKARIGRDMCYHLQ